MGLFGTSKAKQSTRAPTRASELAGVVLPDHDGHEIRLGDLWADQLAVLVWLRHYG